ncbi:DUF1289 domain-containing protein [Massilia agri]|uniref:DUF1289 domain-containing protein n=1 Tax=Massilia agri TaxID=1886785 RepID=A0ABT2AKX2_9BURK|nr:DUF1289 domain-containing protein [Massilia agri]MCS0596894.1 DUF1289 domain-containing protein [Massilia agri]
MSAPHADQAGAPVERPDEALPQRPDTPCVAVCSTTFDEVCRGCGRTYVEVANWVAMSAEEKEKVWVRILAQGYPRRNT